MSLDVFQQVFSLSLASNVINDFTAIQACLQKALQNALTSRILPDIGAEWQLVWGPVVWKHTLVDDKITGPDNSWYVAFHPSLKFEDGSERPTYVIAIAGTPAKSEYAWFKENLAVNTVADFNAWVDGGIEKEPAVVPAEDITLGVPYIATGFVNTVRVLLTTKAPQGAIAEDTTLLDFITNLDQSASTRVITTGHSLGGALSPSLALALVSAGVIPRDLTLTYPTAGPSPGNKAFADLFIKTFRSSNPDGSAGHKGWNLNLVNNLDSVPQAWCPLPSYSPAQNLSRTPTLYGTPAIPFILDIITLVSLHSLSSGILYKPLPGQFFNGPAPIVAPATLEEFAQIAVPQHQQAYFCEVGVIPPFIKGNEMPICILTEKSEDEKRFNFPLLAELEWGREHPEEAQKEIEIVEGAPLAKALLRK